MEQPPILENNMLHEEDTICAIASGMGKAAIGIVRISGQDAVSIVDKVFQNPKGRKLSDLKSYQASYGHILDPANNQVIDEVIVLVMKEPHTYTTEDCVEIDCHGGPFVMQKVMDLLVRNGARPAEPGEFTKRAFLGGRVDMTEAEAVMDVINSENDLALSSSLHQLSGNLKGKIQELREKILHNTAFIEAAIDDPEHYSLDEFPDELKETVNELQSQIAKLLSTFDDGRRIHEGIKTAIVGRPNVGKSSVLNMLLGEERAIVTDIAGTTRDTLEEEVSLGGITLKLIDTAGIRETEDTVEKIGVEKAKKSLEEADLVLFILDSAEKLSEKDQEIAEQIVGKPTIVLLNKEDAGQVVGEEDVKSLFAKANPFAKDETIPCISTSAKLGNGKEELKKLMEDMFFAGDVSYNDQIYITNSRQKAGLVHASESLAKVCESIDMGVGEDFYTIDLMAAYESLGDIIGEALEDDLADKIFKDFCMGK